MGKTGRESLKRRVMEFRVNELKYELAMEVKNILSQYSLSDARDVSAGAATFYLWVSYLRCRGVQHAASALQNRT